MSPILRVVLIIGAFVALSIVVKRVRKSKIRVADSVYWVLCAVLMLVKLFNLSCDVSRLTDKTEQLAQELALHTKDELDWREAQTGIDSQKE